MDKFVFLLLPCIVPTCCGVKRFTSVWTCDFQSDDCGLELSSGRWQRFYYQTDYNVFYEADVASSGALDAYEASFVIPNEELINSTSTTTAGSKAGRLSFRYTVYSTLSSDKRTYLEIEPCRRGRGGHPTRFSSQTVDKKIWNSTSVRFSCNRPEDIQISFFASGGYGRSVSVRIDSIVLEMRLPSARRKVLQAAPPGSTTNDSLTVTVPTDLPPSEGDIVTFSRPHPSGPNRQMSSIRMFTPLVALSILGVVCVVFAVIYKRRQQIAKARAEDQTKTNNPSRSAGHGTNQPQRLPPSISCISHGTDSHNPTKVNNVPRTTSTKYRPSIYAATSETSNESLPRFDDDVVWKTSNGYHPDVDGFKSTTTTRVIDTTSTNYRPKEDKIVWSMSRGIRLIVDDEDTTTVDDKVQTTSDEYCAKVNDAVWITSDENRPKFNGVVRTSSHTNSQKVDYDDIWTLSDRCCQNIYDDTEPFWRRSGYGQTVSVGASATNRNSALSDHIKLKESAI